MLAIIAAFREEVRAYLDAHRFKAASDEGSLRFYESEAAPGVVVVDGAVGRARAAKAADVVIHRYRPDLVLSAGFAGGVLEGQDTGDVFLCDRLMAVEGPAIFWEPDAVLESDPQQVSPLNGLFQGNGYHVSGCLSVPDLLQASSMKEWIGANFPVGIIDMESYWVGQIAARYGAAHAVVRTILDPVGQTLPPFVGRAVREDGAKSWSAAIRHLASHPSEAPGLLKLRRQVRTAGDALGEVLSAVADGFDDGAADHRRGSAQ